MFLQRPFRWLKAISDYKATVSGAPNFAYDMCIRKIKPEQRAELVAYIRSLAGTNPGNAKAAEGELIERG